MRKLSVFNLVTVDGYFAGHGGDISWHSVDAEFQELAETASTSGNTLLFGRVTYELMAAYWTSREACENDAIVAAGMNSSPKIVFSRTLKRADWVNTRLVSDDMLSAVRHWKQESGLGLTVLGSGSIVAQLAQAKLIDEYQILLNPVVLGRGRSMFEGIRERQSLRLMKTRTFGNGNVLLVYEPMA